MDWIGCTNAVLTRIKKYRFALLAVAAGIMLLTLPGEKEEEPELSLPETQQTFDRSLSAVLSLIEGAGRVEVLLTAEQGEETVYQTDENLSADDRRSDTVLITGEGRLETGLIRQVNAPVYRGAVVVCQGADDPRVRLAIVEAVMGVTGLTSDRITVLKMK